MTEDNAMDYEESLQLETETKKDLISTKENGEKKEGSQSTGRPNIDINVVRC